MKTEIHLNAEDIETIIANHYGIRKENVSVFVSEECQGYGTNEHMEKIVKGIITYPNSDTTKAPGD